MRFPFLSADEGQSLVLVAGGFAMLLCAVAFSVDVGYGYAQRRALVNASQAAGLAAGRMMATSLVWSSGGVSYSVKQEDVFAKACSFAQKNLAGAVTSETYDMTVEFFTRAGTTALTDHTRSGTVTTTTCPTFATPYHAIDSTARDVRVRILASYAPIIGGVTGTSVMDVAGSARARVSGASTATVFAGGRPWPVIGHYDYSKLTASSCGPGCTPVTFWSNSDSWGSWKGEVDYSRDSTIMSSGSCTGTCKQLLNSWDQTGSAYASPATSLKTDIQTSGSGCGGSTWDTAGWVPANQAKDKNCAVPNWTYYGFQGTLSLCTNWSGVSGPATNCTSTTRPFAPSSSQIPTVLSTTNRGVCATVSGVTFVTAPSCTNGRLGDWVETVNGTPIAGLLLKAVQQLGADNEFSTTIIPGTSQPYGKALVVYAYLWDCGEQWQSGAWSLIMNTKSPGNGLDCSDSANWPNGAKPDRVHMFAIAPFTFYEGLFLQDSNSIRGYWGGTFASPDSCPSGMCDIGALNTTLLVGD